MKTRYFHNVNCIEELKKQYFALAKLYHSDITGGSDDAMKAINAEYSDLFKVYKDIHKSIKENAPEDFINIIRALLNLGLSVELCGRWLWITGDTKAVKEDLKKLGCRWSANKKAWSWHYPEDGSRNHKKAWDFNKIRNTYGSVSYTNDEQLQLNGAF